MTGKIREMVETMISKKAGDNPMLAKIIKTKLIIHGIYPNRSATEADDDPLILAKLEKFEKELRII
ncbi:MAG: hypothetical protein HXX11_11600 [Desulfuromonadales bacterium]|nr:hypothetical protein [Desulfuromonadales bacterium]